MKNYAYYSNISYKTKILNQFRKLFFAPFAEKFLLKRIFDTEGKTIWLKAIPPEYLYPKNSWRSYERNGIRLKLDISNVVDHLKYYAFKDEGFENFINKLKPDYIILDIGGNIGLTCLEFAKKVPSGKVAVFEPSFSNFKRLQENISLNNFKNIVAVNKGIGDAAGEFKLYNVVDSNPGMKRILNAENAENYESETITIDTIENQLNQLNIREVHAIKIDVEGFELKVLQSAAIVLKNYKPVLFIELDDSNLKGQGGSAGQLIKFLSELDYKIYDAKNIHQPLKPDFNYANCHFDIICE
jgi:FkbM family methyltransferase